MTGTMTQETIIDTIRPMATSGFLQSVLSQFNRKGYLTQNQWNVLERIADEKINPKPKVVLDFAAIITLFNTAATHLKFPKIRLQLKNGDRVVLSRAGMRAKQPGTINVTNGGKFGEPDNKWYGRINLNGVFQSSNDCTEEIQELLMTFSRDPEGVATSHGRLTGNCCFCGRSLTDERSTDVGYGPTCASHFGLNWGD